MESVFAVVAPPHAVGTKPNQTSFPKSLSVAADPDVIVAVTALVAGSNVHDSTLACPAEVETATPTTHKATATPSRRPQIRTFPMITLPRLSLRTATQPTCFLTQIHEGLCNRNPTVLPVRALGYTSLVADLPLAVFDSASMKRPRSDDEVENPSSSCL